MAYLLTVIISVVLPLFCYETVKDHVKMYNESATGTAKTILPPPPKDSFALHLPPIYYILAPPLSFCYVHHATSQLIAKIQNNLLVIKIKHTAGMQNTVNMLFKRAEDTHKTCSYWASIGECKKNPEGMSENFKWSCNVCTCS